MTMNRRGLLIAAATMTTVPALTATFGRQARAAAGWPAKLPQAFARIEKESQGRLGIYVLDTGDGAAAGLRAGERFPMCSTFKLVLAARILARVDQRKEQLDRRLPVAKSDIVSHSPAVEKRVGGDISIRELCEATVTLSDNAAANLLLETFGGPPAMTEYARSIGDATFRLDRMETMMSEAKPGDVRDTTSPQAMAQTLRRLALGDALLPASRGQLVAWLKANKTGDTRIRAGLPKDWIVGDKTGAGGHGTNNDVAIFWPKDRAPVILSVYLNGSKLPADKRDGIIAAIAAEVARAIG